MDKMSEEDKVLCTAPHNACFNLHEAQRLCGAVTLSLHKTNCMIIHPKVVWRFFKSWLFDLYRKIGGSPKPVTYVISKPRMSKCVPVHVEHVEAFHKTRQTAGWLWRAAMSDRKCSLWCPSSGRDMTKGLWGINVSQLPARWCHAATGFTTYDFSPFPVIGCSHG